MDFHKVTYDGDLDDMDADDLRAVVEEYEEAQDDNIEAFESAKDTIDGLEGEVAEKADFKERRVEKLTEVSPRGEDDVENFSLSRIDSLIEEFTEESTEDDTDKDEDPEFDDMGRRGPTHDNEDVPSQYEEEVDSIPGVVVNAE